MRMRMKMIKMRRRTRRAQERTIRLNACRSWGEVHQQFLFLSSSILHFLLFLSAFFLHVSQRDDEVGSDSRRWGLLKNGENQLQIVLTDDKTAKQKNNGMKSETETIPSFLPPLLLGSDCRRAELWRRENKQSIVLTDDKKKQKTEVKRNLRSLIDEENIFSKGISVFLVVSSTESWSDLSISSICTSKSQTKSTREKLCCSWWAAQKVEEIHQSFAMERMGRRVFF